MTEFVPYQPNHIRGWKWKWECGEVCAQSRDDFISTRGTFLLPASQLLIQQPWWNLHTTMSLWVGCFWLGVKLLRRKQLSLSLPMAGFFLGLGDTMDTSAVRQGEGQGEGWELKDITSQMGYWPHSLATLQQTFPLGILPSRDPWTRNLVKNLVLSWCIIN